MKYYYLIAFILITHIAFAQQTISDSTGWRVKVKSLKSGSGHEFSGGPNDLRHFHKIYKEKTTSLNPDDLYKIEMTFNGTNVLLKDSAVSLNKGKHIFDNHFTLFSTCEMYDFDGRGGAGPLWTEPFAGTKNTVSSDVDTKHAAEGKGSIYMEGNCVKSADQKVCSLKKVISMPKNSFGSGASTGNVPTLKSDRNNTWFFLYLYGNEDKDAFFQMMVYAKDPDNGNTDYSTYNVPLNFKGWKTIAVRYSDMNGNADGQIPQNIISIDYRLMSDKPEKKVRINFDYLSVLFNK